VGHDMPLPPRSLGRVLDVRHHRRRGAGPPEGGRVDAFAAQRKPVGRVGTRAHFHPRVFERPRPSSGSVRPTKGLQGGGAWAAGPHRRRPGHGPRRRRWGPGRRAPASGPAPAPGPRATGAHPPRHRPPPKNRPPDRQPELSEKNIKGMKSWMRGGEQQPCPPLLGRHREQFITPSGVNRRWGPARSWVVPPGRRC